MTDLIERLDAGRDLCASDRVDARILNEVIDDAITALREQEELHRELREAIAGGREMNRNLRKRIEKLEAENKALEHDAEMYRKYYK